jgi:hypothetical protein
MFFVMLAEMDDRQIAERAARQIGVVKRLLGDLSRPSP